MKVLHITPTYFGSDSVMAGGERYSYCLAKAMSNITTTTLVTFGPKGFMQQDGELTIKCFKPFFYLGLTKINPFSLGYLQEFIKADVIHCHQLKVVITDLSILLGAVLRKKVFVTDLSGASKYSLQWYVPLWKGIKSMLLISDFNRCSFFNLPVDIKIIYGGVDALRFSPGQVTKLPKVLHVGRVVAHKGIHNLIDALPERISLDVVGQIDDQHYYRLLQNKGRGKSVFFHQNISEDKLIEMYREAMVTVLPITSDGGFTTAMESFACGTPVIGTVVGSLPEVIEDGITGFLVPPNKPNAIREKIEYLFTNPHVAREMGKRGRESVLNKFTWDIVANRCLRAYEN